MGSPISSVAAATDQAASRRSTGSTIDPQPAATGSPVFWAVEVKRKAGIDAVEQLSRYLEYLNRDPALNAPVGGVLAAQSIAPQAKTLAEARGIRCVVVDYDELRGMPSEKLVLF